MTPKSFTFTVFSGEKTMRPSFLTANVIVPGSPVDTGPLIFICASVSFTSCFPFTSFNVPLTSVVIVFPFIGPFEVILTLLSSRLIVIFCFSTVVETVTWGLASTLLTASARGLFCLSVDVKGAFPVGSVFPTGSLSA